MRVSDKGGPQRALYGGGTIRAVTITLLHSILSLLSISALFLLSSLLSRCARRYFPNWLAPLPVPNGNSGTMSVNLNTHNKLLLMAPAYDRHGTVGFRCVADAPGSPPL